VGSIFTLGKAALLLFLKVKQIDPSAKSVCTTIKLRNFKLFSTLRMTVISTEIKKIFKNNITILATKVAVPKK